MMARPIQRGNISSPCRCRTAPSSLTATMASRRLSLQAYILPEAPGSPHWMAMDKTIPPICLACSIMLKPMVSTWFRGDESTAETRGGGVSAAAAPTRSDAKYCMMAFTISDVVRVLADVTTSYFYRRSPACTDFYRPSFAPKVER